MSEPKEVYFEILPMEGFRAEDYRPIFVENQLTGISIFYYPIEQGDPDAPA